MITRLNQLTFFIVCCLLLFSACDNNEDIPQPDENGAGQGSQLKGSGSFVFSDFQPLSNKPMNIYYHVPSTVDASTPIVIALHGGSRDAMESRDEMIAVANLKGAIVIVPEFSQSNFRGSDKYNLGNVFVDGDNPSTTTLNAEDQWTFSLIEPIFDRVRELTANANQEYFLFGFSAGAQFLHRFLFFKPHARIRQAVAASSGWYTIPNNQVSFPYGLQNSSLSIAGFTPVFSKKLTVLIGESDNDPNAGSLRRNSQADAQGTNRYSRAQYFYNQSMIIAANNGFAFSWNYVSIPRVGHDFVATSDFAMRSIFNF